MLFLHGSTSNGNVNTEAYRVCKGGAPRQIQSYGRVIDSRRRPPYSADSALKRGKEVPT